MGLSSSQGRLLMLTSRLNDIELSEVMIAQRQARLAFQSEKAASEYNEKMSNYKIQIKLPDAKSDYGFSKQDLDFDNMSSLGYLVTNAERQIYLKKDENGEWIIPKDYSGQEILEIDENTGKARVVSGVDENGKPILSEDEYELADGTQYLSNPKKLQQSIVNGVLFVFNTKSSVEGISLELLSGNTDMEYVLDTSDDAEAQSKYDYETARLSRQDNQLDVEMQQLETQHNAIVKEYDSVKQVIQSNVDRTFKLFSNG